MILTGSVKLEGGVSGMEEGRANFHNLPPEKQRNIIDAGLNAFGRNGYAKTSMNDVARAAGVSKAALLFRNVNWEKLKPGVDRVSAYQMVTYVSSGFIRDHAEEPPEKIMESLKPLLELLKKALYREEYL